MSNLGLTEEQKKRIEENKQRALALRTEKQSPIKCTSASQKTSSVYSNHHVHTGVSNLPPTSRVQNKNAPSNNTKTWVNKSKVLGYQKCVGPQEIQVKTIGKCVFVGNDIFTVEIGYSAPLIEYFKQLKTRQYNASTKIWSFKMEEYDMFMKGVHNFWPDIEIEGLPRWILKIFGADKKDSPVIPSADLSLVDDKLVQALLPFQRESVDFAIHHNGRLLIADDMGLGKTLQALCIACFYRKEWPLLIVSPSSVKFDWAQQICKWLPSVAPCDINVVETSRASATSGIINIVSYDLLSKKADDLKKKMFKVIIMDESHSLKNAKTERTKAATPLLKNAKRVLLLSGTPALSRPCELFCQITAVCPDLFTFHEFGLRYCNAKQMQWGWDYSSSSNMMELQALLEHRIMIRREKKDVLSQLPAKYRQVIMLDPSSIHKNKDLKVASKIMSNVRLKGANKRGALLQYFHETGKAKLSAVRDYILDLIEAEKKFLVFAHHTEMLDCIEDGIKSKASHIEYIRIDGSTKSEQRNIFCSKFQTCDNYRVAILSITAANAGLNLAAANIVVFAELFWNPGILVQAEDRAHRIGQQDSVSVQYLVAQHTADDYIWPLVQNKLDILSKAGLAKDDFADTDTKRLTDSTQQTILDMFSTEFIVDTVPDVKNLDDTITPDISVNLEGVDASKVDVNVVSVSPLKVNINVVAQEKAMKSARLKTPQKSVAADWTRKIQTKQTVTCTATQGEKTPSKRQASITSFFDHTPPKKMLCLDASLAPQQLRDNESLVKKKLDYNDVDMVTDINEDKQRDNPDDSMNISCDPSHDVDALLTWSDDEFIECLDNDTSIALSLNRSDKSVNQVSKESKTEDSKLHSVACQVIKTGGYRSPCVTSQDSRTGGDRSPCVTSQDSRTGGDRSPCVTSQDSRTGGDRSPCVTSQDGRTGGDRSPYITSQVSRTGGESSPCITSQETGRSNNTSDVSQDNLLWLQDLDWDDEM